MAHFLCYFPIARFALLLTRSVDHASNRESLLYKRSYVPDVGVSALQPPYIRLILRKFCAKDGWYESAPYPSFPKVGLFFKPYRSVR